MLPSYYHYLSQAERRGIRLAVTWRTSNTAHPWLSVRAHSSISALLFANKDISVHEELQTGIFSLLF